MKRLLRSSLALVLGFTATLGAVAVGNRVTDQRGKHLGPLDLNLYCVKNYGPRSGAFGPLKDAYNWYCVEYPNGIWTPRTIDEDKACEAAYGSPANAEAADPTNAYTWECIHA